MSREMKDSGIEWIGEIPDEWSVIPQKHLMYKKKDICSTYEGQDILSLTRQGVIVRDLENPSGKMPTTFDGYQHLEPGNLLMCLFDIDVTPRCIGLIKHNGLTSPAYSQFVLKQGCLPEFYNYYLHMIDNDKVYLHLSRNLRNSLTETDFGFIKALKPSIEEQSSIVTYLDRKVAQIDYIIAQTKQSIEEYKKYKQSLITEVVTKGLDPNVKMKDSGIEWIGEIPEHWDVNKLGYLGSLQNGISIGGDSFGEGHPFVSYSDVYRNIQLPDSVVGLVQSNTKEQVNYSVQEGDVFFTRTSETIEEVGFACTCFNTIESAVFAGFLIRFRQYRDKISKFYSKYYFRSDMHRKFFVKEMNLVTRASLSQGLLKKLPVLVPPYEEQEAIGNYLDEVCSHIDNAIEKKQNIITELESYKKSLIYEVVTGKKEVS